MGTLKTTNIQTITGSGTLTLGTSGETVTVPTGVTVGGTMSNTPAFRATQDSNQTIPTNAFTKLVLDVEQKDTNSAYDTSNYRFTVPTGYAGQYFFSAQYRLSGLGDQDVPQILFYKNGGLDNNGRIIGTMGVGENFTHNVTYTMECSVGDYFEVYVFHNYGSNRDTSASYCNFQGFRLIGT